MHQAIRIEEAARRPLLFPTFPAAKFSLGLADGPRTAQISSLSWLMNRLSDSISALRSSSSPLLSRRACS